MPRLIGFLSGLLLVLTLAIVALRQPELLGLSDRLARDADHAQAPGPSVGPPDREALPSLPRADAAPPASVTITDGVGTVTAPPAAESPRSDAPIASPPAAAPVPRADDTAAESPPTDPADASAPAGVPPPGPAPAAMAADAPPPPAEPPAIERQWFAFWMPFHSQLSAEGFRSRLERVTGLDYRIQSSAPGEYQVAFAYRDEAERQQALAAIEAATGLALRSNAL